MRKSFSRLKASFGSAGQNGHTASSGQQPAESHHPACPPKPDTAATNEKTRPERQPKPASGSAAQTTVWEIGRGLTSRFCALPVQILTHQSLDLPAYGVVPVGRPYRQVFRLPMLC